MADRRFTIFHLNLIPIKQYDIETQRDLSREQWIHEVLRTPLELPHHGGRILHWVPKGDVDGSIFGVLQMKRDHIHHASPRDGGDELVSEEWQGAFVLVDPTHHAQGQRVAVENDVVGKPNALLKSLVGYINETRNDKPYEIYISQIFEEGDFWAFAEENGNVLQSVTFEFIVPNMFPVEGNLEEEIKDTGEDTNAEKLRFSFLGNNGILAKSKRIKKAVDYISRHAGRILATSLDGDKYSSDEQEKTTSIPKIEVETEHMLEYLSSSKNKVLGYEDAESDNALDLSSSTDGESSVD